MNEKQLKKGIFIAFEGIDGAGKSLQARLCLERLTKEGYSAVLLREPTNGPIGQKIRALAQQGRDKIQPIEEFKLFLEDRREDVKLNIEPALNEKKIVLIDRYYYSSIAYQGALGLDPEFIRTENEKIAIRPDRVYYLSIPLELSAGRIVESRRMTLDLFEKEDYLKKVKAIFDSMKYPEILKIDASFNPQGVFDQIMADLYKLIGQNS